MRGPTATFSTWSSGIGQGPISATPLQMANVAATIARGGVWVRPTLIAQDSPAKPAPTTQAANRVDLGVPPEALRAVREGMFKVVHTRAGSGGAVRRKEFAVAGKTGTAEAARILVNVVDPKTGKLVLDEKSGKAKKELLKMSNPGDENPEAMWYRGTGREGGKPHHSWFIGYAPAENPQVAFAVLVEYGGSGGGAAGAVANKLIDKCIAHGTLKVPAGAPIVKVAAAGNDAAPATAPSTDGDTGVVANRAASVATPLAPAPEVELLRPIEPTTQPIRVTTRAAD
jgi:cell division protein FtsI/penicillin-binding protein 2